MGPRNPPKNPHKFMRVFFNTFGLTGLEPTLNLLDYSKLLN